MHKRLQNQMPKGPLHEFSSRLDTCFVIVSLLLYCSCWHFESFLRNAVWCHQWQWCYLCNKPKRVNKECTFTDTQIV